MKTYNFKSYFVALASIIAFSCSENENKAPDGVNLIVGEWHRISEHTYDCDTDEILSPSNVEEMNYVAEFLDNGTQIFSIDGQVVNTGLWEALGDNLYILTAEDGSGGNELLIEFPDNNTMNIRSYDQCSGSGDNRYYASEVSQRI